MKKKIGLLGGISYKSTLEYYKVLMEKYYAGHKDYYYPEVIIYSLDFQKFTDFEDNNQLEEYRKYILEGMDALIKAGSGVIAMTANSPHKVFYDIKDKVSVKFVSIVEAVAKEASRREMKRVLLLGIKFTMQGSFYQEVLKQNSIETLVPSEEEQDVINTVIFEELSVGIIKQETREKLLRIIDNYSVDGVILGCTELPLILSQKDSAVPFLDTIDIHTSAILKEAIQESMAEAL